MDMQWVSQKAEDIKKKAWVPWKHRKCPRRAMLKNGSKNVVRRKMTQISKWRYLQDIFTTLMDAQWRWTVQFIVVEFFGCWLVFALVWWLIAFVHGDLHDDHLPLRQPETGWTPCVLNIHGFHSCFLYSIETQHTTGYGLRVITEECPEAIFIMCLQCIVGLIIDSFTIGIVFAKLVRPKFASQTVQFSRNAVLCRQDGKLCFMFRVGDIRRSRMVGVGVRAILVRNECTKEGETLSNYQTELSLKADGGDSSLFLLWPLTVYHEIDDKSPLFDLMANGTLRNKKFEIIVILNATVESTGASAEAKSSYIANEILWSRKFEPVVSFNKHADCFEIDWSRFDNTVSVNNIIYEDNTDQNTYENISDTPDTCLLDDKRRDTKNEQIISDFVEDDELIIFENNESYLPSYTTKSTLAWTSVTEKPDRVKSKAKYQQESIKEYDERPDLAYV